MSLAHPAPAITPLEVRRHLLTTPRCARQRTYWVYSHRPGTDLLLLDPRLPVIVVGPDTIRLGDSPAIPAQVGRTSVTWHRTVGTATSGTLFFTGKGVTCHGTVVEGPADDGGEVITHEVFASAVPPTIYATRITTHRHPEGTEAGGLPEDAWQDGPRLALGYRIDPATRFPRTVVEIDGQDFSTLVELAVNSNDELQLTIDAGSQSAVICAVDPRLPLAESITFELDGMGFCGTVSATCAHPHGAGVYLIDGRTTDPAAIGVPPATTATSAPTSTSNAVPDTADTTSLAELLSLVPDSAVGDQVGALLVQSMKWAIGQDETGRRWLQDFWQQTPPALSTGRRALITQDLEWYQRQYAVGHLAYGLKDLTGPGAPHTRLNQDESTRLESYLTVGLATSEAYNRQTAGLYRDAYLDAKPRLQHYLEKGGDWAEQVLAVVGTGGGLSRTTNLIIHEKDARSAGNITALLATLDPSGNAASRYQERLLVNLMAKMSLQTTVQDEQWTMAWLPDLLEAFTDLYARQPLSETVTAGSTPPDEDARATALTIGNAATALGGFTALAHEMARCLLTARRTTISAQSEEAAQEFARANPRFDAGANAFFAIAWLLGLVSVILAFRNFTSLGPVQRAAAINRAVGLLAGAIRKGISLFTPTPSLEIPAGVDRFLSSEEGLGGVTSMAKEIGGDTWVAEGVTETSALFDAAGKNIATEGTTWAKVFTTAGKIVALVGILVSAIATFLSAWALVDAIKTGDVTSAVLNGLLTAANTAVTVALIVGVVVESVVPMMLASAFAIAGLIIILIDLFLPKPEEPTPAETFMSNVAVPFVNALPTRVTA